MFDEQNGLARRLEAGEAFGDTFAEFGADAGHGFVEQEQAGVHRGAAGQGEELLLAVGDFGGRLVGDLGEEEFFQQGFSLALVGAVALTIEEGSKARPRCAPGCCGRASRMFSRTLSLLMRRKSWKVRATPRRLMR